MLKSDPAKFITSHSYRVSSVHSTKFKAMVRYEARDISAEVLCLEVVFVASDQRHGSLTLRFIGDEINDAVMAYQVDRPVVLSIQRVGD